MNVVRSDRVAEDRSPSATDIGRTSRGQALRDFASSPRAPADRGAVDQVNSLIAHVTVASVKDIETLIDELQNLRDFLQREGQRVQREIAGYARLSDEATKSTKIIAESVAVWKDAVLNSGLSRGQ